MTLRGYRTVKALNPLSGRKQKQRFIRMRKQLKLHLQKIDHLEGNNKDLSVELARQRMESQQLMSRLLSTENESMGRYELIVSLKKQMKTHESDLSSIRSVFSDSVTMMASLIDRLNTGIRCCSDGQRRSRSISAALLSAVDTGRLTMLTSDPDHVTSDTAGATQASQTVASTVDTVETVGSDSEDGSSAQVPLRAGRCFLTDFDEDSDDDDGDNRAQHDDGISGAGDTESGAVIESVATPCPVGNAELRLSVIEERSERDEVSTLTALSTPTGNNCSNTTVAGQSDSCTADIIDQILATSSANILPDVNTLGRLSGDSVAPSPVLLRKRKQPQQSNLAIEHQLLMESSCVTGDDGDGLDMDDEDRKNGEVPTEAAVSPDNTAELVSCAPLSPCVSGRLSHVVGAGRRTRRKKRRISWLDQTTGRVGAVDTAVTNTASRRAAADTVVDTTDMSDSEIAADTAGKEATVELDSGRSNRRRTRASGRKSTQSGNRTGDITTVTTGNSTNTTTTNSAPVSSSGSITAPVGAGCDSGGATDTIAGAVDSSVVAAVLSVSSKCKNKRRTRKDCRTSAPESSVVAATNDATNSRAVTPDDLATLNVPDNRHEETSRERGGNSCPATPDTSGSRRSRSHKKTLSYKEPSLSSKLRR